MSNASSKAATKRKTPGAKQLPGETTVEPVKQNRGMQRSPWTAVIFSTIVFFAGQIIAANLVSIYPAAHHWSTSQIEDWLNSVNGQFWFVLLAEVLTFAATWKFVVARGDRLSSIGWKKPRWVDLAYTLAGFFAYFILYMIVLTVATHLITSLNTGQKQELGFDNVVGAVDLTLAFISLVVLPPIVEETVFRGLIFTSLRSRLSFGWATLATSVLFAIPHLQFGTGNPLLWVAALDVFSLSLVLCYLREQTGSLWPGIGLHALKNGLTFVTLFVLHVH